MKYVALIQYAITVEAEGPWEAAAWVEDRLVPWPYEQDQRAHRVRILPLDAPDMAYDAHKWTLVEKPLELGGRHE